MRIAIVGFGLIGGSIARALAKRSAEGLPSAQERPVLVAWSPSGDGPRRALEEGVIDEAPSDFGTAISGAELVVLAGPALACLELIGRLEGLHGGALDPAATVTDAASTKQMLVERADACGLRFVGGHPMAGRELSGYAASVADLFVDRPWVVVRGANADDADVARVEWLARACGGKPLRLSAPDHDAAVAAISHAPLVLSAALAGGVAGAPAADLGVEWAVARGLAASGWRDTTRLAHGDPEMGAGISATNAENIARVLRLVRDELDDWVEALESEAGATPDPGQLRARFERARARLGR
jgi:prephenate dehydrogenase